MNNIIKRKDKAIKDYKLRRSISSDFYERVAKPVTEKTGEQIRTTEKQTGLLKGLQEALAEIHKPMIEYEKEGERLRGIEEEGTHYVNLDWGISFTSFWKARTMAGGTASGR